VLWWCYNLSVRVRVRKSVVFCRALDDGSSGSSRWLRQLVDLVPLLHALVTDRWHRLFYRLLAFMALHDVDGVVDASLRGLVGAPNEHSGAVLFYEGCPVPSEGSLSLLE
jgi:hypothetical protein